MKFVLLASLALGAAAFVPGSQLKASSALSAVAKKAPVKKAPVKKAPVKKAPVKKAAPAKAGGFAAELGVQQPLGFWDPLGLLDGKDQARFERLRYVEIKHGRIAMLAVVGYITTEFGYRLPGAIDSAGDTFESIPAGFASLSAMPAAGLVQILTFIGLLEISWWKQDPNSFPGDFGASSFPVGFVSKKYTEAQKLDYRAKELNQGRAAQMGILALMVHEQLGVDILPPH
jgi:Chlorophyll A-B binding protein